MAYSALNSKSAYTLSPRKSRVTIQKPEIGLPETAGKSSSSCSELSYGYKFMLVLTYLCSLLTIFLVLFVLFLFCYL